jgi:hypothetical protein
MNSSKQRFKARMRTLNRIVLLGAALFVPLYLGVRLTGSMNRLESLPDALDRIKYPVVWSVPDDGVRDTDFFHGPPEEGHKFVIVRVQMEARMKIAYPVVPKCFRLVDDEQTRHYPLARSPLFIERTNQFYLDQDDFFEGELLFEIPHERKSERLLFDRYKE